MWEGGDWAGVWRGGGGRAKKKEKCRCICFDQIWPGGSIRKIFITCALGKVLSTNSVEGVEGVEGGGQGGGGDEVPSARRASEVNVWLSR